MTQTNIKPDSRRRLENIKEIIAAKDGVEVDKISFSDAVDFLYAQLPKTESDRVYVAFDNFKSTLYLLLKINGQKDKTKGALGDLVDEFRTMVLISLGKPDKMDAFVTRLRPIIDDVAEKYNKDPGEKKG